MKSNTYLISNKSPLASPLSTKTHRRKPLCCFCKHKNTMLNAFTQMHKAKQQNQPYFAEKKIETSILHLLLLPFAPSTIIALQLLWHVSKPDLLRDFVFAKLYLHWSLIWSNNNQFKTLLAILVTLRYELNFIISNYQI